MKHFDDRVLAEAVLANLLALKEELGNVPTEHIRAAAKLLGRGESSVRRYVQLGELPANVRTDGYRLDRDAELFLAMADGKPSAARRLFESHGGEPPPLRTFQRGVQRIPESDLAYLREGVEGRKKTTVYLEYPDFGPNDRFELDATILPIFVIPTMGAAPIRPRLVAVREACSGGVTGFALCAERPHAGDVLSSLGWSIRKDDLLGPFYGTARVLVWDNAKKFMAKAVDEAADKMGSRPFPAALFSPEQKPFIESVFKAIKLELIAQLPGRTKRPKRADGTSYGQKTLFMTLRQLAAEIREYLIYFNNERPRSDDEPRPPAQIWIDAGGLDLRVPSDEEIRVFTTEKIAVTVQKSGIRIHGARFFHPELRKRFKEPLFARMRRHDYRDIDVYDEHDNFICNAKNRANLTPEEVQEALRIRHEENARLKDWRAAATREEARLAKKRIRTFSLGAEDHEPVLDTRMSRNEFRAERRRQASAKARQRELREKDLFGDREELNKPVEPGGQSSSGGWQ